MPGAKLLAYKFRLKNSLSIAPSRTLTTITLKSVMTSTFGDAADAEEEEEEDEEDDDDDDDKDEDEVEEEDA